MSAILLFYEQGCYLIQCVLPFQTSSAALDDWASSRFRLELLARAPTSGSCGAMKVAESTRTLTYYVASDSYESRPRSSSVITADRKTFADLKEGCVAFESTDAQVIRRYLERPNDSSWSCNLGFPLHRWDMTDDRIVGLVLDIRHP